MESSHNLAKHPIHLGLQGSAQSESPITGMEWYTDYVIRHKADGAESRLVSEYTFTESWNVWEMHPLGSEVVYCIRGEMDLIQERKGKTQKVHLKAGEYAINEPGVWHTADVSHSCTALFITAGWDTQHKERE
ncbi:MAG: cupin [Leptospiraceae bacterium]|nr:cupin [Leptospiraceae bacterium]